MQFVSFGFIKQISMNKINLDVKLMKPDLILFNFAGRATFVLLIQSIKQI